MNAITFWYQTYCVQYRIIKLDHQNGLLSPGIPIKHENVQTQDAYRAYLDAVGDAHLRSQSAAVTSNIQRCRFSGAREPRSVPVVQIECN